MPVGVDEPGRSRRRKIFTVVGLLLASAAVRFAYVASVWDSPWVRYPFVDSRAYHERALAILAGDWSGEGVFYQDPLYPFLLAGLYAVFGEGSLGVLLAQSFLDSCSAVLIYLTARRVFDARVALVAGLIACFYKVFFYYDALLLKVPLTLFLISLALYLAVRADSRDTARSWLAAGFAFGLASLTRGNYLFFAPLLIAWPCFSNRSEAARRLLFAGLVAAGFCAAILPVTLRNYAVAGDFVLITSQAGQNFYIGNHRGNRSGVYQAPPFVRANPLYEQEDFRVEGERRAGRKLAPSELSRFWFREAVDEIRADPGHFARHLLRKARVFANDYEVPDNQSYAFFAANVSPALRLPMPTFGLLLPLAACGACFARRNRRAALLALFFVIYAGSVILFFNMSRYRIPVLPAVIVLAAAGAVGLQRRLRARELRSGIPALVFLAAAYPLVFQDLSSDDFSRARRNMGAAYVKRAAIHRFLAGELAAAGEEEAARAEAREAWKLWDLAEDEYRKALEIQPRNRQTRRALRQLLVTRVVDHENAKRWDEALERALILTSTYREFAEGHALLGAMYARLGQVEKARLALERALSIAPRNRRALSERARLPGADSGPAEGGPDADHP